MRMLSLVPALLAFAFAAEVGPRSALAQEYNIDAAHTSVSFKISHLGLSMTHGRFNTVSGSFTIAAEKSKFALTIATESVDTGNQQRDDHLRGPDFFSAKEFPTIKFQSTGVKPTKEGLEVKGDLTLHGKTKPVMFKLEGGKTAEFPKGVQRTGYSTQFTLKRSEFGMENMLQAIGDEVVVDISFEGTQKK